MRWVYDPTRRFKQRPYYELREIDDECEQLVTDFLRERYGKVEFPISTDDFVVLMEAHAEYVDRFADLSDEGPTVQGVTYFRPGKLPIVKVSRDLGEERWHANRLRTTLSHEFGHVRLHNFLWVTEAESLPLFGNEMGRAAGPRCLRSSFGRVPTRVDWMEWQAAYASGSFLMPRHALGGEIGKAPAKPYQPDSPDARRLVEEVRRRFAVSGDAAMVRLAQLTYTASQEPLLGA